MTRLSLHTVVLALAGAIGMIAGAQDASESRGAEFFEKRVRPLFIEHCHECHSATTGKSKGGLQLDSAEDWLRGGDSGPALVPGEPAASLLIRALHWKDPDLQMPPKQRLPDAAIATLEAWIEAGAPGPATAPENSQPSPSPAASAKSHWAYQPLVSQEPPAVRNVDWPTGSIDRFILAGLEERGLDPAPDADRAALCRRLYFDLTGLPPTPEEVDAFVADDRPEALGEWVDRLLASPRFGEHWARHWFDIVRFAESVTLRGFVFREAWRYRDYVIDAFNRDVPLDRFIQEQLAGDLLPAGNLEAERRQRIATTFLMLGNTNLEEQDKRQLEMDFVDEQIEVIGKALLGQTIACARCHDHKFDPIPTTDYYALAGILKNVVALEHANVSAWVERPLPLEPELEAALLRHEKEIAELDARIKTLRNTATAPGLDIARLPGLVVDSSQARRVGEWQHSTSTKPFLGDGYLHDQDKEKGAKTLTFAFDLSRAGRYEVRFAYTPGDNRSPRVPITVFHAGGETLVHVNERERPPLAGHFVSLGTFHFETNGFAHVLVANESTEGHVIADAVQLLPAEVGELAATPPPSAPSSTSTPAGSSNSVEKLEARLKTLKASGPQRPKVMAPREATNIVDLAVHRRGSVHVLGEIVPRGFLTVASQCLPQPAIPDDQSGRLELGAWITAPENPLASRVQVNRVWLWLLGEGLVRTPDNFGTTGESPTHPALLDWLAVRFVSPRADGGLGWSTKALIREIVLSRAYRLATTGSRALHEADPNNRLLGRALRKRLTAEQLRDAMLATSGGLRLELPLGPTFPKDRAADYGFVSEDNRRSVYLPVFRNALPDVFEAFDFPSPSMVVGRRDVSTVPTQALFLLNHPFVRHQARLAASRLALTDPAEATFTAAGTGSDSSNDTDCVERRIIAAYRVALGRRPSDSELAAIRANFDPADETSWVELFHALFASIDFRYLD